MTASLLIVGVLWRGEHARDNWPEIVSLTLAQNSGHRIALGEKDLRQVRLPEGKLIGSRVEVPGSILMREAA
jgi:hypothetical protein